MSVTLVDVDATWVNPGSVSYNAAELRLADAAMFITAGVVRSSSTALSVSVDGSDVVTVKAGSWAIPGNAVAGSGVWRGGIASDVTGNLEARDATNGRIDLVVARQLDTDVVGTHGAYTGRVEIIKGTPSATPGVPALPSMAVELGRITVPKSGGGSASVDLSHRTYATAPGGEIVVPSSSMLPASAAVGQRVYALDTGVSYRWNGTTWDDGTWNTYTPTWTATTTNPSLGNGSIVGRWRWDGGKTVEFKITLTVGSTTTAGSGEYYFTLPVPTRSVNDGLMGTVVIASSPYASGGLTQMGGPTASQVRGIKGVNGAFSSTDLPPSGRAVALAGRYETA